MFVGLPGLPDADEGCSFIPVCWRRPAAEFPNYWRALAAVDPTWDVVDHVIYLRGAEVEPAPGTEILVDRVAPRPPANRPALVCSHFQSPHRPKSPTSPPC